MSHGSVADLRDARRVLCFGATGSGKSTAAAMIGTYLDLPVTLVDDICWLPGWQQRPAQDQHDIITGRLDEPTWVFDSIYRPQHAHALQRVDVIVALDYPRYLSLGRLLRRTVRRIHSQELVCNGNVETWRRTLTRDSILWWHFRSWARKRAQMRSWHADPEAPPVILLRHPREFFQLFADI